MGSRIVGENMEDYIRQTDWIVLLLVVYVVGKRAAQVQTVCMSWARAPGDGERRRDVILVVKCLTRNVMETNR